MKGRLRLSCVPDVYPPTPGYRAGIRELRTWVRLTRPPPSSVLAPPVRGHVLVGVKLVDDAADVRKRRETVLDRELGPPPGGGLDDGRDGLESLWGGV